jgi:valyl-tRNA synthetase
VHRASWPSLDELGSLSERPGSIYQPVCDALEAVRREKSTAKVSQRAGVARLTVTGPEDVVEALRAGANDLRAAGNVTDLVIEVGSELRVDVVLESD